MTTVVFKRKLTAILSAGEEGYSHLVREDEVARVETLKMSGRRKLYIWTLSLLAFVVFTSGFGEAATAKSQRKAQQNTEHNVAFRWAFGALVRSEKDWKLVAITPGSKLKTGNRLKMLIELLEDCFVYVIYHSPQGEIRLLFPYDFKQLSTDYETQKQYLIPPGDRWFELDEHLGIETFYLLASVERLFELEALVKKYALLPLAEKDDCKDQILADIRSLIRRHRRFKTAAERPVQMVGAIRGGHETSKVVRFDLLSIAVEIAADRFYGKSFTIDHQ